MSEVVQCREKEVEALASDPGHNSWDGDVGTHPDQRHRRVFTSVFLTPCGDKGMFCMLSLTINDVQDTPCSTSCPHLDRRRHRRQDGEHNRSFDLGTGRERFSSIARQHFHTGI